MELEKEHAAIGGTLKCSNCGAVLQFAPGTRNLRCDYCGTENEIPYTEEDAEIRAVPFDEFLRGQDSRDNTRTELVVKCINCGAATTLPPGITSDKCPFCASPLVIDKSSSQQILKPHYVLPFVIRSEQAGTNFKSWLKGLWFAPGDLMKQVNESGAGGLKGIYLPYWAYDADTQTHYSGQRGEYYYVTESYEENGQRRTRQVRHTRWHSTSGVVEQDFRNVLVSASSSLPQKTATILEPWKLDQLAAFDERFLSGFRSETWQTDAASGFGVAKSKMEPRIRDLVCSDIGGDEQLIDDMNVDYRDPALKYILLPVWISSYKYGGKVYQFVVNASTGEVTGERPWSTLKIVLAVLAGIALLIAVFYLFQQR
jgi:LSD1 subclass zinc finger protein